MATVINAAKLRSHAHSKSNQKYEHLRKEQEALQLDLTTNFPKKENLLFDKELGFLMLNGCLSLYEFKEFKLSIFSAIKSLAQQNHLTECVL